MAKHADLEIGLGRRGGQDYVVEFRFTPPNSDSEDRPPRPGTLFASLIRGDDYNALRDTQGADLNYDYSPAADVNYHVEVYPRSGTGPYSLTITPLHKYDAFEPNDDILSAKTLSLGKTIDANIMDEKDVDFVRVKSERTEKRTNYLPTPAIRWAPTSSTLSRSSQTVPITYKSGPRPARDRTPSA